MTWMQCELLYPTKFKNMKIWDINGSHGVMKVLCLVVPFQSCGQKIMKFWKLACHLLTAQISTDAELYVNSLYVILIFLIFNRWGGSFIHILIYILLSEYWLMNLHHWPSPVFGRDLKFRPFLVFQCVVFFFDVIY